MQESTGLTVFGMVSGLMLPESMNELRLNRARIFRNPAASKASNGYQLLGANTALFAGEGEERHFAGEVATYLIESEIEAPNG